MQKSLWQSKANGPFENNNTWIRYGICTQKKRPKLTPEIMFRELLNIQLKEIIYQKGCSKLGLLSF